MYHIKRFFKLWFGDPEPILPEPTPSELADMCLKIALQASDFYKSMEKAYGLQYLKDNGDSYVIRRPNRFNKTPNEKEKS